MKRAGELIERIANADNLRLAFWKASRGKRAKAEVLRFRADLDARLRILREKLFSASVAWGPYRTFKVYDPKERMICVAPFRDRVAQHAIINVVEPHFESYQIHDSYACRRGKGLDGAIARAVCFSRPGDWYLKMDVRKYFDSIHHGVLKGLLRRRFKDPVLLALLDGVINSYAASPGRGVPIGNLTSQFFANHYLAILDHRLKEIMHCRRYVRYMDDFVVWDSEKGSLATSRPRNRWIPRRHAQAGLEAGLLEQVLLRHDLPGLPCVSGACPAGRTKPNPLPPQTGPVPRQLHERSMDGRGSRPARGAARGIRAAGGKHDVPPPRH